jgi:integrase
MHPSVRQSGSAHLSTRQYARLVKQWIALMGEDPAEYGTHSLRRTKATLIYRKTKNLRAVQLLLGHRKIESTVRYYRQKVVMCWNAAKTLINNRSNHRITA